MITLISLIIIWYYPMATVFLIPLIVIELKKNVSVEDAVITKDNYVMSYNLYIRNSHLLECKAKRIKALKVRKAYFTLQSKPFYQSN